MKIKKPQLKGIIKSIVKETLDIMNETLERGEWWIYPGGDVQFADGDIGDSNHEGYVISNLSSEILGHFGINTDEAGYLSDYEDQIKQSLLDDEKLTPEEIEEWDTKSPSEIVLRKVVEDKLYNNPKQAEDAVYIAYGSSTRDARDYAMKYLGWKRLTISHYGIAVQTWFLTNDSLRDISRGISDAGGEDFGMPEETDEDNVEVEIEVRSNNKRFSGIPLSVVDQRNVSALFPYEKKTGWINEGIFHENKDWIMYEGDNKITTLFKDNSRLAFEVGYPRETWGEDKDKWRHRAASKWKSIAREIYNSAGLTEAGNPIIIPWRVCYKRALNHPDMKEFIRKDASPVF